MSRESVRVSLCVDVSGGEDTVARNRDRGGRAVAGRVCASCIKLFENKLVCLCRPAPSVRPFDQSESAHTIQMLHEDLGNYKLRNAPLIENWIL